jgi:hypothetical protein
MCAILSLVEPDRRDPFVDKARILQCAEVAEAIDPAWEYEIEDRAAAALKPGLKAPPGLGHYLELHRPAGFLLDDRCAVADVSSAYDISDPDLDDITTAQLAVDCEVEERSVAQSPMFVEIETDGPYVTRL